MSMGMEDEHGPIRLRTFYCACCGRSAIHKADIVFDKESASVWHCLVCGNERRPPENGSPNQPAIPFSPKKPGKDGAKWPPDWLLDGSGGKEEQDEHTGSKEPSRKRELTPV